MPLIIIGGIELMKDFISQKAIRLKSWLIKEITVDGKFNLWEAVKFSSVIGWVVSITPKVLITVLKIIVLSLNLLLKLLPSLISFMESLISTLSYPIRKRFFYELFLNKALWII